MKTDSTPRLDENIYLMKTDTTCAPRLDEKFLEMKENQNDFSLPKNQ